MPRIYFVTNLYPTTEKPYFGTFVKNSAEQLSANEWEVSILSLTHFGSGLLGYLKFYLQSFKQLIRAEGIAYVHYVSHSSMPVILACLVNKKLNMVLHYHGSDAFPEKHEGTFRRWIKYRLCKVANRQAVAVIAPSEYFAEQLADKFHLNKSILTVSPSGGIDTSVFYPDSGREQSYIKRILFAGRMIEEKGCILAAKTAKTVLTQVQDVHFSFVGSGPLSEQVEAMLADERKISLCVFSPSVSQKRLAEYFRESDFFLFPSIREGESLGLVLVEAMACGCIPVAFDNGAVSELLGSSASVLICDREDNYIDHVQRVLSMSQQEIARVREALQLQAVKYRAEVVGKALSDSLSKVAA